MKDSKKALNIVVSVIGIVLCVVFGLLLICNLTIIVKGLINPKRPPSIFGVTPMVVKSGSMSNYYPYLVDIDRIEDLTDEQKQALKVGDTIKTKSGDFVETNVITALHKDGGKLVSVNVDRAEKDHIEVDDLIFAGKTDAAKLKVGDVISFMDKQGTVTTHRIIQLTTDEDGRTAYVTKGDANNTDDVTAKSKNGIVKQEDVIGIYKGRIAKIGSFILFLQKPWGMIIFIGVPVIAFVVYDIIRRTRSAKKTDKKQEELEAELTRLRKLAEEKGAAETPETPAADAEKPETGGDSPKDPPKES